MLTNEQVLQAVRRVLAAEPDVRWGYVFGSVARGEPYRDVDVAVMLRERRVVVDKEPQARCTWEAETTCRWLDFEPSYEEYLRRRNEAMRLRLAGGR